MPDSPIPIALPAQARRVLRERFGVASLRPGQAEVLASVLRGNPTIAVMPTGSGKSLCYQVPALCNGGLTVVVSPLIALMKDQDEKLREYGVDAGVFNSATPDEDQQRYLRKGGGKHQPIVLATPERLGDAGFMQWLRRQTVRLFVVDEAHCISQWGHDFRPAFLEIPAAVRAVGSPPVLAMTATATDEVIHDIAATLDLPAACVIKVGVYRPNLDYAVRQVSDEERKQDAVLELVREAQGPAIVYSATVKEAEILHQVLRDAGMDAALYHGRLNATARRQAQDAFMSGTTRVMVATDAFGMGIDKPDVRLVVHAQLPGSLDAYYQESGRAGRDGEPARCILIHEEKDKRIQQFFLANRYPSRELLLRVLGVLEDAPAPLAEDELLRALGKVGARKLRVGLKLLADAGLIEKDSHGKLRTRGDADARARASAAAEQYERRAEHDRETLAAMVGYARSGRCRWRMLLAHFGDVPQWERCGHCDSCDLARQAEAVEKAGDAPPDRQGRPAPLRVGDGVRVRRYGAGVVEAVTRERVDIRFPNGDLRRFLPGYVTRLKGVPPVPPVPAS
ncbi:ATP-dependent DNA helicase RecQ [Bordetella sp. H567]|uniref:RecQ family ATP-dependent DNA helicase n=1 Tax=Bordetella sp. H567 TaxID=1697043 RepID=UPI00081D180C|nr:RecQ family ATP-dependent DNA helicase [Bordetella sp. H567]AOB32741.1 ATP-dependent DNA helicase RecQ [Bordetella sp. H567]